MSKPALRNVVAMAHVADVPRSIAFYEQLGFTLRNTVPPAGSGEAIWAWMESGAGQLMLAKADGPVDSGVQAVLFYLYFDGIDAVHAQLSAEGLKVGPMKHPFYNPKGEFRLEDPDGYVLMLTHA